MKMLNLTVLIVLFGLHATAQSEPFVKALKTLPFGSSVLDGTIIFQKDFPNFKKLTTAPVPLQEIINPKNKKDTLVIEAFYLINEKGKELIQLYYVDNQLYEKAVYWFFDPKAVSAVETKYKKCHNSFVSNHELLQAEGGVVNFEEETYELGRKTVYPIKSNNSQGYYGESGYHLIYNRDLGERGFWVYAQVYNTLGTDLLKEMDLPQMAPPDATFDELPYLLTSVKK